MTAILNQAGVGVSEVVHGALGVTSAPCVTHAGPNAYIAVGSTKDPANVTLALYDPGSTPAVASLSFATSSGPVTPPIFQGLSVLSGQVILVNVGHYVLMKAPRGADCACRRWRRSWSVRCRASHSARASLRR